MYAISADVGFIRLKERLLYPGGPVLLAVSFLLFLLTPCWELSLAGSATQTDWSGGDGVSGPVTNWQDQYYTSSYVHCPSYLEALYLEYAPEKYEICDDYNRPYAAHAADMDSDGDMDVIAVYDTYLGTGGLRWWENLDGSGWNWEERFIYTSFWCGKDVWTDDIDGDGDLDVVASAADTLTKIMNEIAWFENCDGQGTTWDYHEVADDLWSAFAVHTNDIDGDGDVDVLGAMPYQHDIKWFENLDGSGGSWEEHFIEDHFSRSVHSEDIDGDGDIDIIGAALVSNEIKWWENYFGTGGGWVEHLVAVHGGVYCVHSADVDGDGDMDILSARGGSPQVHWWENSDGAGTAWTQHLIDDDLNGACTICPDDIDADGDIDVVGGGFDSHRVEWWENTDGSGLDWIEHVVDSTAGGPRCVFTADMNGDGNLDVLGADVNQDRVLWWDVNRIKLYGYLTSSILDLQEHPEWLDITWNCTEPAGTDVAFQVRTSSDPGYMGEWSDYIYEPGCISDLVSDGDHLLQYRVHLESTDHYLSPVLDDITVSWDPTGTEGGSHGSCRLLGAVENPCAGLSSIAFYLPEYTEVEIRIYDVNGRIVHLEKGSYDQGTSTVSVDTPSPGMYFVLLSSGTYRASDSFVVVEDKN